MFRFVIIDTKEGLEAESRKMYCTPLEAQHAANKSFPGAQVYIHFVRT